MSGMDPLSGRAPDERNGFDGTMFLVELIQCNNKTINRTSQTITNSILRKG